MKLIFSLSWIEIRHKKGTATEGTHLHIFSKFIIKINKKTQWDCKWEKMSIAMKENKDKFLIKRIA